jgi:hypothetical protein
VLWLVLEQLLYLQIMHRSKAPAENIVAGRSLEVQLSVRLEQKSSQELEVGSAIEKTTVGHDQDPAADILTERSRPLLVWPQLV